MINKVVFNREPLARNDFASLPIGAIVPKGWLEKQLRVAADGLTGRLCEFWPDVSESAWRGGDGDAWERAPYYLDGLVPLAYLLDDEALKKKAEPYIEWTLASQRADGQFGPEQNPDWWPRMVMLKALASYYTATGDKRVPEFMLRYFAYEYKNMETNPLASWAVARAADNMVTALWLYNLTGRKFLVELCNKLRAQCLDWTGFFSAFELTQSMAKMLPWPELSEGAAKEKEKLAGEARPFYETRFHFSHVVNVAMGLKQPGVVHQFKSGVKEREGFEAGYRKLMRYHGVANGMFTGDEHLSGASPTQGTETCAVVETMYSLETLLDSSVADAEMGDILEKLAFNALPAAQTPDNLRHQYLQQANQVKCSLEKRNWYNNHDDSNLYGLEPNYGCCTANLHQGWSKYAASLWYATSDGGFAAMSYAPCQVRFFAGEAPVRITVDTAYPFEQSVRIRVECPTGARFPLKLRIPAWAKGASVALDGAKVGEPEPGAFWTIEREWRDQALTLTLPMTPRVTNWHHKSVAVELGPLLMALRPEEKWTTAREHDVVSDLAVDSASEWRYALTGEELTASFSPEKAAPFGYGQAVRVQAQAAFLPEWEMDGASCAQPPIEPKCPASRLCTITLVPYGDTNLRISQFPRAVIADAPKTKEENP